MARSLDEGTDIVYAAAERFVDVALRRDDSLFTPGQPIWSLANIRDAYQRFVENADYSRRSFSEKLQSQLSEAPPETVQFFAELMYFHYLVDCVAKGHTKRQAINAVLKLHNTDIQIPDELAATLDVGILRPGTRFNTHKYEQLSAQLS